MSRRVRWTLLALAGLLLLVLGVGLALTLPRADAIRFLLAMKDPAPADRAVPEGLARVSELAGARGRALVPVPDGERRLPGIVVVHGVTDLGVDDGRLAGLALAFRAAGFAPVVPEVEGLVRFGSGGDAPGRDDDHVLAVLRAVAAGRVEGVDGSRLGLFGVSVGGPLALGAAARFRAEGGRGVRAVCLVGAPEDLRRVAKGWFATPPPSGPNRGAADDVAEAAVFARNGVWGAAAGRLVPPEDRGPLRRWLAGSTAPKGMPEGVATPAGTRFAEEVLGALPAPARVEEILDAAWDTLRPLSPAHRTDPLDAPGSMADVPAFLLHGADDPLVPASELAPLAARLAARMPVRTLTSRLLAHTTVGTEDAWETIGFLDEFFDRVREGSSEGDDG